MSTQIEETAGEMCHCDSGLLLLQQKGDKTYFEGHKHVGTLRYYFRRLSYKQIKV